MLDTHPESVKDPWRRIVLENALDAVVGIDEDQNILDWNRQAEVIFGWTHDEVRGRKLGDIIIPPRYRAAHAAGMKHFLSTGEGPVLNRRIEVEGLHRNGAIFPIELTVIPLNIEGRPVFYSFLRDISERKRSEDQFRTLAESIPQFTWIADPNGERTWYNQRWYDYTGEDSWLAAHHPDHRARVAEHYEESIAAGEPWEDIFPLRSKTGEWRWFLSRAHPVKSSDGKVLRWFGSSTDVTEQRRNRENIAFLSEASVILSSSLDYNDTLQRLAKVAVPKLGDWCAISVAEESTPRSVAIAHPDPAMVEIGEEYRTKYPTDWNSESGPAKVLRTGQSQVHPFISDEMLVRAAQSEEHLKLMRALQLRSVMIVPIRGRSEVLGILTLVSSSETHRYSEEDLKIAEDLGRRAGLAIDNARLFTQAQEAIRMRDEFISIASHELKTPLTSIKLQTELNIRQFKKNQSAFLDSKAIDKLLTSTVTQVDRLSKLVDDMLDIARIAHGKLAIQPEEVDLGFLVRDVVDRFHEQLAAAGCKYRLHVESQVMGRWDRYRLEQVVANLITNAIKYGAGKPVDIAVSSASQDALITVKDHGMGIGPDHLERIFQRFERAITSTNISGLGLGLYISRQIVEAHGGKISVESTLQVGSTFTVELPLLS